MKKKSKKIDYICAECGKEYGTIEYPVTWHNGICDECGKEASLCHVRDYGPNPHSMAWD